MKNLFYFIVLIIILPLSNLKSYGVSAYPYPFQYTQPDGSVITIMLKGDEKVHWAVTMDGYTLLRNAQDGWEYATRNQNGDLVSTGVLAHEGLFRTASEALVLKSVQKNLHYSINQINTLTSIWEQLNNTPSNRSMNRVFTPMGTKNLVMILIGYTDLAFTKTQADFAGLMNQIGYNLNGAVGSVKDYFLETSYGNFNVTTTVAGPYTAAHDMNYYGADNGNSHDVNSNELITEAVTLADANVNYANFDNDNDGTVDGVYVIYAGYGQASGAPSNTIWPHAGSISTLTLDGKTISKYSCSNELQGTSGSAMTTIGVICHEFGHVCGAPDYYDTDYETVGQYDGMGNWDLMAEGSWNGSPAGNRPPHMNPLDKIKFNWAIQTLLTSDVSLSINDIRTDPVIYRYNTTTANEYYLLENRQKTGFNTSVPGHGLMIYHVDGNFIATAGNTINCTSHQGMFPMAANATTANGVMLSSVSTVNTGGCPWPGISGKTIFNDATTPNSLSWAGANTNSSLLNIAENTSTKVITLCFKSCPAINPILSFTATAANASEINLSWANNPANNDVIIAYNTTNTFGTLSDGITYNVNDVLSGGGAIIFKGPASSFNHTSLAASSSYYYQIWALTTTPSYSASAATNTMTLCNSVTAIPFTEGFEGGVIPSCWTQEYVNGSNAWSIQSSGINGHPSGAHSGTKIARCNVLIVNAGYITKLVSPPLDLSGTTSPSLKFWHTQDFWGNQDMLKVYYRTSALSAWNVLATYNTSIPGWTQESITLPNPSSTYYIAFEAIVNAGYGVCLDDIIVSSPMADFTANGNLGCTGNLTVDFTDNSLGPNGSWAWDVDNNGTTDYTTQNPTHTYSSPGLYSVKLTINNGSASITKENLILVMSSAPTANTGCTLTSNSNSGNGFGIGIARFALSNIDYSTSGNDGYYQNYTCTKWTRLELNTTYNVTIRTGTANNEGAKVYIDYNDNGIFDAAEAVVSFPANKDGTRTLTFTTPSTGVVVGKGLRLRVLSKFGAIPSTACDISTYGQAEDYTVYFISNTIATGTINSLLCQGSAINVPFTITGTYNTGNVFTAQLSDATGSFSTQQNIGTLTATAAGTINAVIPVAASQGTAYKIRVISSSPSITGTSNAGNLTINQNPVPSITGATAVCAGSSNTLDAGTYSAYIWSTTATTRTISVSAEGTYTVTVTDGNGCSGLGSLTETVNPVPLITPSSVQSAICNGSSSSLSAGSSISGTTFLWNPGSLTGTPVIVLPATTTVYTVAGTVTLTGCSGSANITVTVNPSTKTLQIKLFLESLYSGAGLMNQAQNSTGAQFGPNIADRVSFELHNASSPYNIVYSESNIDVTKNGILSTSSIPCSISSSYYIVLKHRNSVETWSNIPVDFSNTSAITYDFTTSASQAFSNNQKLMPGNVYAIYAGDETQDGYVDVSDMSAIDNASTAIKKGYYPEDINGDGIVDVSDMSVIDNNSTAIVRKITP
jgi:M6 family metalloprotease-like protein